jgi:hypothetical protein
MLKMSASNAMVLLTGDSSSNRISITGTSQSCMSTFAPMPARHNSGDVAMFCAVAAASPGTTS